MIINYNDVYFTNNRRHRSNLNVSVEASEARGVLRDSYSVQNETLDESLTSEESIGHQGMAQQANFDHTTAPDEVLDRMSAHEDEREESSVAEEEQELPS